MDNKLKAWAVKTTDGVQVIQGYDLIVTTHALVATSHSGDSATVIDDWEDFQLTCIDGKPTKYTHSIKGKRIRAELTRNAEAIDW